MIAEGGFGASVKMRTGAWGTASRHMGGEESSCPGRGVEPHGPHGSFTTF